MTDKRDGQTDALKCKISSGKTRQRAIIKRKGRLDVEIKMTSLNQACGVSTMRMDGRTDRQTTTIVPIGRNVVVESRHSRLCCMMGVVLTTTSSVTDKRDGQTDVLKHKISKKTRQRAKIKR